MKLSVPGRSLICALFFYGASRFPDDTSVGIMLCTMSETPGFTAFDGNRFIYYTIDYKI
jgi:hypothetical protein